MKKIQYLLPLFLFVFIGANFAQSKNHEAKETSIKVATPNMGKVDDAVKKQLNDLLLAYFQIKNELVASNLENTNAKATIFLETLEKINTKKMTAEQVKFFSQHREKLVFNAKNISNNSEIYAQRGFFSEISVLMKTVIVGFKANTNKVYEHYCPMAFDNYGASWLSPENKIFNPYYGDMMLKCGTVKGEF